LIPLVAFRINLAISFVCDTSDAWLAGSEIVVAFVSFEHMDNPTLLIQKFAEYIAVHET